MNLKIQYCAVKNLRFVAYILYLQHTKYGYIFIQGRLKDKCRIKMLNQINKHIKINIYIPIYTYIYIYIYS